MGCEVIEKDGKFYWYVTVTNDGDTRPGKMIGVAVADMTTEGVEPAK